jgi:hypothetical protein
MNFRYSSSQDGVEGIFELFGGKQAKLQIGRIPFEAYRTFGDHSSLSSFWVAIKDLMVFSNHWR